MKIQVKFEHPPAPSTHVLENSILRRIFGPKGVEVTREHKKTA
jgi:hypothetical protein